MSWCARCGARLPVEFKGQWFEESERCRECGVAAPVPPMLAAGDGEAPHSLAELSPSARAWVTSQLQESDVLYRWEPDLVLVVPSEATMAVARILDDVPETGEVLEEGGVGAEVGEEFGDGGAEAQEAMADLFVAAADLRKAPYDDRFMARFVEAADAVQMSLPPYGIDPDFWRGVQRESSAVTALISSSAPDEMVAERAEELRAALRDYV